MGQDAFKKFINPKKNSVVKEEIRQDKKKARKEKREYFETKKADRKSTRLNSSHSTLSRMPSSA